MAGIVNVAVVEKDLKETLEFLAERHMQETGDCWALNQPQHSNHVLQHNSEHRVIAKLQFH